MIELSSLENYETYLPSWNYYVISEKCHHIDLGEYHTYGIRIIGFNYTMVLHDVSTYREIAIRMVKLFNRYQLSPIHLKDIMEDMLPFC